jgi:hypothetical protein
MDEWYAYSTGTLSGEVITATYPGNISAYSMFAQAVSGTPSSSFFDSNGALPSSSTGATATITTSNANDMLISFANCTSGNTDVSWPGSAVEFAQLQWQTVSSTQSAVAPPLSCTSSGSIGDAIVQSTAVASPLDLRVKNSSASIYGAGASFSTPSGASYYGTFTPGPDILGTSRPISGRYDIGAQEFVGSGPPPPSGAAGRLLRR